MGKLNENFTGGTLDIEKFKREINQDIDFNHYSTSFREL